MRNQIRKDKPVTLYYQLKQILIKMIDRMELKENDKLPTENELCQKYNVSRSTVRKALDELEDEDYIYRIQGKGSFVSPKKFQQDLLKFYSFTNEMKKIGKNPTSEVLDFKIYRPNEKLLDILELEKENKVYEFTRLRLADGEPMMLETTYIPYKYFKGLTKSELDSEPLYNILINKFNVIFSKAEETFRATSLTKKEALELNYIEGAPSILLERLTYDSTDKLIEYTKNVTRGDKFKYHVVLKK